MGLGAMKNLFHIPPREPLWNVTTLARQLNVSQATIYSWVKRGEGPQHIRVGGGLRWRPTDVEKWMKTQEGE